MTDSDKTPWIDPRDLVSRIHLDGHDMPKRVDIPLPQRETELSIDNVVTERLGTVREKLEGLTKKNVEYGRTGWEAGASATYLLNRLKDENNINFQRKEGGIEIWDLPRKMDSNEINEITHKMGARLYGNRTLTGSDIFDIAKHGDCIRHVQERDIANFPGDSLVVDIPKKLNKDGTTAIPDSTMVVLRTDDPAIRVGFTFHKKSEYPYGTKERVITTIFIDSNHKDKDIEPDIYYKETEPWRNRIEKVNNTLNSIYVLEEFRAVGNRTNQAIDNMRRSVRGSRAKAIKDGSDVAWIRSDMDTIGEAEFLQKFECRATINGEVYEVRRKNLDEICQKMEKQGQIVGGYEEFGGDNKGKSLLSERVPGTKTDAVLETNIPGVRLMLERQYGRVHLLVDI